METKTATFTTQQLIFKELFVGTLIYATVLGFFNDIFCGSYSRSINLLDACLEERGAPAF